MNKDRKRRLLDVTAIRKNIKDVFREYSYHMKGGMLKELREEFLEEILNCLECDDEE